MADKRPIDKDLKEFIDSDVLATPPEGILVNLVLVTSAEISFLENSTSNLQEQIDLLT